MKKFIKSFFVAILLLIFYLTTQITAGVGIGIVLGVKYASQGMPALDVADAITNYVTSNTNMLILVSNLILLVSIAILFLIKRVNIKEYMNYRKLEVKKLPMILCYALALQLVGGLLIQLMNLVYPMADSIESMTNVIVGESFLMTFLMVGILAPVAEEVFFRGLLFNKIKNNTNLKFAVILQGVIFGLVHGNIAQFLPTFILACVAAVFYHKTKSILWPIALHMFYNIYAVIAINLSENMQIFAGIIVIIASVITVYSIIKSIKDRKNEISEIDERIINGSIK